MSEQFPIRTICKVLKIARSSLYYALTEESEKDAEIEATLLRLAGEWPTYGYRRLTQMLRREGYKINQKRVRKIMRLKGLLRKAVKKKVRTTNSKHDYVRYENLLENQEILRVDQVWVADITYIRLREEFVYLAVLMDVHTRQIRGWELSGNLDARLTINALKQALTRGIPEIHHSDQGVQYACGEYIEILTSLDVLISMAKVGEPRENGYAERLMRTIKEEEVELKEYEDMEDAREHLREFLEGVYNRKRIHSSLGYLTPEEYEAKCLEESESPESVKKKRRKND